MLGAGGVQRDSRLQAEPGSQVSQAAASEHGLSRTLLDQYCVRCHNERMKTAGVMFDKVEVSHVDTHRELFEKVARKLRKYQMPPANAPQPDEAARTSFVAALEGELDRIAGTAPNPGRVASRRLNRAEYVNAIRDLLALEIDGAALLPSDMSGFGFDNNADVLSITPALMDRYMTAATKISRLAVGSLENRAVIQSYKVPTSARAANPHGRGPAVRDAWRRRRSPHVFTRRGICLQASAAARRSRRNDSGQHRGTEHEIEVRMDHALVKRLPVGGKFKGQVRYDLRPAASRFRKTISRASRSPSTNQTADKDLEVRVPVKAGTRVVAGHVHGLRPLPRRLGLRRQQRCRASRTLEISGPYKAAVAGGYSKPASGFSSCRPPAARTKSRARRRSSARWPGARTAGL